MYTIIGLRTRIMPDEQIIAMTILVGGGIFPLMAAMALIAPERADGTIVRLLTLPVPTWHVLAAKAMVGVAVCAAPVLVSAVLAAVIAGNREMAWSELIEIYAMALGVAVSMFTWLTAAGVRQPSEARAGLAGIGMVVAWILVVMLSSLLPLQGVEANMQVQWVAAFSPFGLMALIDDVGPTAYTFTSVVIVIQISMVALVWLWSARRIGKPGKVVA
ncbi:MAG: ABC transporter permease [Pseudomonadota bacterium]|nr:ABC transporter permease [Pseudomonadota bacterium]